MISMKKHPVIFIFGLTILAWQSLAAAEVSSTTPADPFLPPNIPTPSFDQSKRYNVMDFGATGKGQKNDTSAIDKAIDKCSANGGGSVIFPAGTYLVASIHLKSNVQLLLDDQATIMGTKTGFDSPEKCDFDKYQDFGHSHYHDALMWGEDIENFAIVGGTIDGGSLVHGNIKPGGGDKQIAIKTGKNLLFKNITQKIGGHFVYLLNNCENVTITNVVIKNSRDAVDLMSCRNVQVSKCNFTECVDDTIGVKSDYVLGKTIKSENIYVWDCYFESGCNGLQFGSETAGDFSNVNFWNIKIGKADKAGIGITSCDGAVIDNVNYRDITMHNIANPIFMLIIDRLRTGDTTRKVGTIKNVTISNVVATEVVGGRQGPAYPCTISGRPDAYLENIVLNNVSITYKGGGTQADAAVAPPPYSKDAYAPHDFGPRPASGLYVRNVKGLQLHHVKFQFETPDQRPPLIASDVDGLELDNFESGKSDGVEATKFDGVKNLNVHDSPGL